MIYINNMPIMATEYEILDKLKYDCKLCGLDLFHKVKKSGDQNLMTTCPFHKGGQERNPSFGISLKNGMCHCFTCGWRGPLNKMISEVFNYLDGGNYGNAWLSRNFLSYDVQVRRPINVRDRRKDLRDSAVKLAFTEEELDSYRYIHPYMYERKLTDEVIRLFDVGYDVHSDSITFPTYYVDKTPAFIARRSVQTKFFNYPKNTSKPVYGADKFYEQRFSYAVICESVFNTLTCWKWGIPSVALFGTGSNEQYQILQNLPVRKFILGLDNDDAGNLGAHKLKSILSKNKIVTQYDIPKGMDINDLDQDVLNLKEFF